MNNNEISSTPRRSNTKYMVMMLLSVAALAAILIGFGIFKNTMIKKAILETPQVATVATAKVSTALWQDDMIAIGSLRAVNGVDLASESSGLVEKVNFKSGDEVEEGTVLVQLRTSEEEANLRAVRADARLAEINSTRNRKLLKDDAVSQATVDVDTAKLDGLRAQMAQLQAVIDKKTIVAPFKGTVGLRNIEPGQYLAAGAIAATLQQTDPLYADFTLPQQALSKIKVGQLITVTGDAAPQQVFAGEVIALDAKIDTNTRNIGVRAKVANPEHLLLSGMYVTVKILVGEPQKTLIIPRVAVISNTYGQAVYVVTKTDENATAMIAKQQFITTGITRGDETAVLSGLKEGEEVVIAGQNKLRSGATVAINNTVIPTVAPAGTDLPADME